METKREAEPYQKCKLNRIDRMMKATTKLCASYCFARRIVSWIKTVVQRGLLLLGTTTTKRTNELYFNESVAFE